MKVGDKVKIKKWSSGRLTYFPAIDACVGIEGIIESDDIWGDGQAVHVKFYNGYSWDVEKVNVELINTPQKDEHYNNDNGSLYLFAQHHNLNAWEFDILKRVVRCRKKGQFKEDLEKTKRVIDLYLKEFEA